MLLVVDLLGAYLFVHARNGIFVDRFGYELVLALGAATLVPAAVGARRFGVDHALLARRGTRTAVAVA